MSWQVLDGWRWSFPDMPFSHVLTQPKSLSTSLAMNDEQGGSGGGRLWFWWSTLSCQVAKPTLPNSFLPKQTRADSGMWNDQKHSQVNPGSQPSESPCILKDNTSDLWTNFKLGYFCSCTKEYNHQSSDKPYFGGWQSCSERSCAASQISSSEVAFLSGAYELAASMSSPMSSSL